VWAGGRKTTIERGGGLRYFASKYPGFQKQLREKMSSFTRVGIAAQLIVPFIAISVLTTALLGVSYVWS